MSLPDQCADASEWLSQNPEVLGVDDTLPDLLARDPESWDDAELARVQKLRDWFEVHDMESFYRVQGHRWLLRHPELLERNAFAARAFQSLQRLLPLTSRDQHTLDRTVWKFMSEEERADASASRRAAERQFGTSHLRRRPPRSRPPVVPLPPVAGFPYDVAAAYMAYHRADAEHFMAYYFTHSPL